MILLDGNRGAVENMDLDRALFESFNGGSSQPFSGRVYGWKKPSITLGIGQNPEILDRPALERDGVEWAPRITGGKAVLHHRELTYVIAGPSPSPIFGKTLFDTYLTIGEALCGVLNGWGIPAKMETHRNPGKAPDEICFDWTSLYEIEVDGRKICGSAQKRSAKAFLQHGSIPLAVRQDAIRPYLVNPPVRLEKEMACLGDFLHPLPPWETLAADLARGLSHWVPRDHTPPPV